MAERRLARRLALGSAQFGMHYGINNSRQVPAEEVLAILRLAREAGVDMIDTAAAYGSAQRVIGSDLSRETSDFRIVSKVAPDAMSPEDVVASFNKTTDELGVDSLYGLLVHDFDRFTIGQRGWEGLRRLRGDGRVRKIGFSVYYPRQVDWLIQHDVDFDLIQLPFNLLDQRFAAHLPRLAERRVETHVRSVFLQGLFFISESELPEHFDAVRAQLAELRRLSRENQLSIPALALGFVLSNGHVARTVIGVDNARGLQENIEALADAERVRSLAPLLADLAVTDERIILPVNWPQGLKVPMCAAR